MPVTLQSAIRQNPAPCQHFNVTIDIDGSRTVSVVVTPSELEGQITDEDVVSLLKIWSRYRSTKGDTLGALVGKVIFSETV